MRILAEAPMAFLLLHAGATLFMTGLIWFVQVVHYPLFASVGAEGYSSYQTEHMRRTGLVVGPVMLVEAGTAAALPLLGLGREAWLLALAGIGLLLVIWLSTFLVQVPLHGRLARGFDARSAALLVSSNWVRTVAWSIRGAIAVALVGMALRG